jgi:hypothetical protein
VGAYLESGTTIGRIAQDGQFEAILVIAQEELEFVRLRQRVDLYPSSLPGQRRICQIEHLSHQEMQVAPANLSMKAGGPLATRTDDQGVERPLDVIYQASVPLADDVNGMVFGTTGQAKIYAGYQPLAARLWRSFCRTFRFEL